MRKRNAPGRRRTLAVMLLTAGIAGLTAAPGSPAIAGEYTPDTARSVFAVLTHKAGIAAGLAHDHLIVAAAPTVALEFDRERPETTRFTFVVGVEALEVDAPAARAAWKGRLHELGIHSGELPPVPDSDRLKVRAAMLGASQLDAAQFPEIRAEVLGFESAAVKGTGGGPGGTLTLRLTIRGRTLERRMQATWSEQAGILEAEAFTELRGRDFGIQPYSTMLGAIRNDDLLHLFVHIVARAPATGG